MKVCKFGGTSMANAESIKRVAEIVTADVERRIIVVSAPGKRRKDDVKVTDLLYECHDKLARGGDFDNAFRAASDRFLEIADGLRLKIDAEDLLADVKTEILARKNVDYTISRGEYVSARLLAEYLGFEFVDASSLIRYDGNESYEFLDGFKCPFGVVIPGFYGTDGKGNIRAFSRGGADITGAIVAKGVGADIYENWTDVDGVLAADPRVAQDPPSIACLGYEDMRALANMGADVLHPDSILPLVGSTVVVNVRNTFNPEHKGTLIRAERSNLDNVVCVACKKDVLCLHVNTRCIAGVTDAFRAISANGFSLEYLQTWQNCIIAYLTERERHSDVNALLDDLSRFASCKIGVERVNLVGALFGNKSRDYVYSAVVRNGAELVQAEGNLLIIKTNGDLAPLVNDLIAIG